MLQRISLGRRDLAAEFAGDSSSEESPTHPHPAMNTPAVNSHACLCQGTLPREDVCIDGIDESSVKIKDQ